MCTRSVNAIRSNGLLMNQMKECAAGEVADQSCVDVGSAAPLWCYARREMGP